MKNIIIVDYGMGNLRSVQKALERCGARARISDQPSALKKAEAVVLPGVGAFGEAMRRLRSKKLVAPMLDTIESGKAFLGICLGLQLLFEKSDEDPGVRGLSVFKGTVKRFPKKSALKIPHMGWNQLTQRQPLSKGILKGLRPQDRFYFVHSYFPVPSDSTIVATTTSYGLTFCSSVAKDRLFASQFHPEKSGDKGLQLLKNFVRLI